MPRTFTIDPDIRRAETLPGWVYSDPGVFERTREAVFAPSWQLALEQFPVWPHTQVHMLPVVEAGAFDLTFVEREAKWFDDVQRGTSCEAGAACISGVPVNLRVNEHHVNRQCVCSWLTPAAN